MTINTNEIRKESGHVQINFAVSVGDLCDEVDRLMAAPHSSGTIATTDTDEVRRELLRNVTLTYEELPVLVASYQGEIDTLTQERDELRVAINTDGSLKSHQEHVRLAEDGADALEKLPFVAAERDEARGEIDRAFELAPERNCATVEMLVGRLLAQLETAREARDRATKQSNVDLDARRAMQRHVHKLRKSLEDINNSAGCSDCGTPYGERGWVDAVVSDAVWAEISGGYKEAILCLHCMTQRAEKLGYGPNNQIPLKIASGPWVDSAGAQLAAHPDTELLDKLERLLWSDQIGNGLILMPSTGEVSGERHVTVEDLGDEDVGDALTAPQPNLRTAIAAIEEEPHAC